MPNIDITFSGLRQWQLDAWAGFKRHNVIVAARRSGKTVLAILWLLWRVAPVKNALGAYVCPYFSQAKRVAWPYVKQYAAAIPGAVFNEAELRVTFPNGASIICLGSDNAHAIRGVGLGACVLDEVAQIGPDVWQQIIRPALADKEGHSLFIGTPFGRGNAFYETYRDAEGKPDWYRALVPWDVAKAIKDSEIDALKAEMSEAAFDQEFNCSFDASVRGAFYGKEMAEAEKAGRIGKVPHDPTLPVSTSWDLGFSDLTVVWFWQKAGPEIRAIECLAFQSTALPDVVRELSARPYKYDKHYLPHDAKVRELGTGKSRVEILQALGLDATVVPAQSLSDGIEAVRTMIPRVWFDREKCGNGVEGLKTYRTEWDDQARVFNKTPLHSWESHYADAVRYFALGGLIAKPDWGRINYRTPVYA